MVEAGSGLLELVVGSLDLVDVELLLLYGSAELGTYLVHLRKPLLHQVLLAHWHRVQRVEELPVPHDRRMHDDLVDQRVGGVDG